MDLNALKEQLTRAAESRERDADLAQAQIDHYRGELARLEAVVAEARADAAAIRENIGASAPTAA